MIEVVPQELEPVIEDGPRAVFLDIVLRALFVLALLTALPSMGLAVAQEKFAVALVDACALVVLGLLRFNDGLPHRVRALGIIGLTYGVGTWFLFELGWVSHVYLLAVPVMAALLLGLRPAVASLVVVALTMAVAGLVFDEGPYLTNETFLDADDEASVAGWAVVVANFTFIAASLSVSCAALFDRFERALAANERSRRQLTTVVRAVDQAEEVVIVSGPDGSILYANTALDRLVADLVPLDRLGSIAALPLLTAGGDDLAHLLAARTYWAGDMEHESSPGQVRTFAVSIAPVSLDRRPGDGSDDRADPDDLGASSPDAVIVMHEVTERRVLEERLRQGEQFEALGMMAGGVAHDLKNIVATISAVAETAHADAASTEDARLRSQLTAIGQACRQAGEILRQLMSLGQRMAPDRTPIRLSSAIADLETLLHAVVGPSINLDLNLDAHDAVEITPSEVSQLLSNLVINARDAIRPGSGRVWISLTADRAQPVADATGTAPGVSRDHLVLKVGDTGSGIAPEELERIFEPFFTTKPLGEGTGLGLPSVHAMVTSLGGSIEISSVVDHGTEFSIRLPVAEGATEPVPAAAPLDPAVPRATSTRQVARIVMVDDEALLLSMCAGSLRRAGHQVQTFSQGHDAIAHVTSDGAPDLLITDLSLGDTSGLEVLSSCRRHHPDLPAIIVSGSFFEATDIADLPTHVLALEKPFTMAQLLDAVDRSISNGFDGREH